ncbi:MAG: plastocyanin/azurin family copper-binding protein [Actinomycetes bacterium]
MLIASSGHTPFYIAAGVLALWAVVVGAIGIKSANFPNGKGGYRLIAGVTFALVIATVGLSIVTAGGEKNKIPRPEIALGVIPQPGAAGQGDAGADASNTPDAPAPSGDAAPAEAPAGGAAQKLAVTSPADGSLVFEPKALTAKAGEVTIVYKNPSPVPHNAVIVSTDDKVIGTEMKPFTNGEGTSTATLKAGSYKFICEVPGHVQAGMVGTLTVS